MSDFLVTCLIFLVENREFLVLWSFLHEGYSCNPINPNGFVLPPFFSDWLPGMPGQWAMMADARSGAAPLLIMALLRLVQAQEVPLIPGRTLPIHLYRSVSSSSTITSRSGSLTCFVHPSVCRTVWLLGAWRLWWWRNETFNVWAAAPFDWRPDWRHYSRETSVTSEDSSIHLAYEWYLGAAVACISLQKAKKQVFVQKLELNLLLFRMVSNPVSRSTDHPNTGSQLKQIQQWTPPTHPPASAS